jgi:hypothetical protein
MKKLIQTNSKHVWAIIFLLCLIVGIPAFAAEKKPVINEIKINTPAINNKTIINKNTPSTEKTGPGVVNKTIKKKELQILIALEKKGKKLYVKLNQVPAKVDLFTYRMRLHSFPGKGNTRFNITPYLSKARGNSITVFAYSTKGKKYQKNFNLAQYASLLQKKKKAHGMTISTMPKKSKKQPGIQPGIKPGIKRSKGLTDHTRVEAETFIPGGITLSVSTTDSSIERGTTAIITYQFVRAMDHLPEEIEFRLTPRLSSVTGDLLGTVRLDPKNPYADVSAIREVSLLLPFGVHDGGVYTINASSRNPSHTGKSNTFRIITPDSSLGVYTPDSSDTFPPGVGLNIPVEYSFHSGATPANVIIRIARERGGYNMELYNGPPLSSHSLPRPPDTCPEGDYRIVVNTDDGRIGYSEIFSLSPYRFYLISPIGGEAFRTKYEPWQFRWHAEAEIDFIEAVLLKGGVEMYRWTPHINFPDHLLGDDLLISPSQPWHPAGTDYKLKIEGYRRHRGDSPTLVAVDESDSNFEVIDDWEPRERIAHCSERTPISIVYPSRSTTGISWKNNKTYPITWCVHDESVGSVDLSLVNASTGERLAIRMGVPNRFESLIFPGDRGFHGGSMDWTVPESFEPGNYRIHIRSSSGEYENTTYYGLYINNWLVKGASPARSTVWNVDDIRMIEWESGGLSDQTVDIFLRHWDSRSEYQVADNVPNTGRFTWLILSEALPEGITRWENVYFKIIIDRHRTDSEFFTIIR